MCQERGATAVNYAASGTDCAWQIPASVIGAIVGAWLLLHLPATVFARVVPVLLIVALVLVVIAPRIQAWARARG